MILENDLATPATTMKKNHLVRLFLVLSLLLCYRNARFYRSSRMALCETSSLAKANIPPKVDRMAAPDVLWRQYLADHSQFDPKNRNFAVVVYPCPHRAGNFLNNLFNNIAWAVLYNRTILVTGCALKGLHSYSPDKVPPIVPVSGIIDPHEPVVMFPQIRDVEPLNEQLFRAPWSGDPMRQNHSIPQNRLKAWYSQGNLYWKGMLFRELILSAPVEPPPSKDVFSVAVHSRHIVPADDGSYLHSEIGCLEKLLKRNQKSCYVHVMSDRTATLEGLDRWIRDQGCVPRINNNSSPFAEQSPLREEHGPRSGYFLEDLQMASRARHGLVGHWERSSFVLLHAVMAYDHYDGAPIQTCWTARQDPRGYSYPGSPLFVSDEFLPAHPVTQILQRHRDLLTESPSANNQTVTLAWDGCVESWFDFARNYYHHALAGRSMALYEAKNSNCTRWDWYVRPLYMKRTNAEPTATRLIQTNLSTNADYGAIYDFVMGIPKQISLFEPPNYQEASIAVYLPPAFNQSRVNECLAPFLMEKDAFLFILSSSSNVSSWPIQVTQWTDNPLQGLYSLARARRGFIGPRETPVSRLILAKLEFERTSQVLSRGQVPPKYQPFDVCYL